MHACLDDLVIALYVTVDELLGERHGPGRPPRLSDSELVCLAIAQVLLGYHSERRWLRAVNTRLGFGHIQWLSNLVAGPLSQFHRAQ